MQNIVTTREISDLLGISQQAISAYYPDTRASHGKYDLKSFLKLWREKYEKEISDLKAEIRDIHSNFRSRENALEERERKFNEFEDYRNGKMKAYESVIEELQTELEAHRKLSEGQSTSIVHLEEQLRVEKSNVDKLADRLHKLKSIPTSPGMNPPVQSVPQVAGANAIPPVELPPTINEPPALPVESTPIADSTQKIINEHIRDVKHPRKSGFLDGYKI